LRGGYSGGGAPYHGDGYSGGGGGSYNSGNNQNNQEGQNQGNGYVIITPIGQTEPDCDLGCWDLAACNFDETAVEECVDCCIYAEQNYDCDGLCLLNLDCFGICGGDATVDACGICDGPGPQLWYYDSNNDNIPEVLDRHKCHKHLLLHLHLKHKVVCLRKN
jgi:hypothetical protein